jgi:hypothetical protein
VVCYWLSMSPLTVRRWGNIGIVLLVAAPAVALEVAATDIVIAGSAGEGSSGGKSVNLLPIFSVP